METEHRPKTEHHPDCELVNEEGGIQAWACVPECPKRIEALNQVRENPEKFEWLIGGPEDLY